MKSKVLLITGILLSILLHCSNTSIADTGSGSEAGNSVVMGTVVFSDGTAGQNVEVTLIPEEYNPVNDATLPDSLIVNTDTYGTYQYSLADTGVFNIYIYDPANGMRALHTDLVVVKGDTLSNTDTLRTPGGIHCIFDDSVAKDGSVYIEGTAIQKPFSDGTLLNGGYYGVILDSVPVGLVPAVKYTTLSQSVLVSDSAFVTSLDTIIIGVIDTLVKPLWRFSCLVGVTEATIQMFGGMDEIQQLIEDQIAQAEKKFNDPGLLNGVLQFSADSFYQFNNDLTTEIDKPLDDFDYRFLYYSDTDDLIGSYTTETRTILQVDRGPGLFSQFSVDALAWCLGMARGVVGLEWLVVRAQNNPVNGQDYLGIASFMNWPYGENTLDVYSIDIINDYGDSVFYGPNLVNWAFPENITITVRDLTSSPVSNTAISLYGVGWKTFSVDTPAVITGISNSNGEFVMTTNPYNPDDTGSAEYLNFLITAVQNNDTAYTWMPVTDIVIAWLHDPESTCRVPVQFKGK